MTTDPLDWHHDLYELHLHIVDTFARRAGIFTAADYDEVLQSLARISAAVTVKREQARSA